MPTRRLRFYDEALPLNGDLRRRTRVRDENVPAAGFLPNAAPDTATTLRQVVYVSAGRLELEPRTDGTTAIVLVSASQSELAGDTPIGASGMGDHSDSKAALRRMNETAKEYWDGGHTSPVFVTDHARPGGTAGQLRAQNDAARRFWAACR